MNDVVESPNNIRMYYTYAHAGTRVHARAHMPARAPLVDLSVCPLNDLTIRHVSHIHGMFWMSRCTTKLSLVDTSKMTSIGNKIPYSFVFLFVLLFRFSSFFKSIYTISLFVLLFLCINMHNLIQIEDAHRLMTIPARVPQPSQHIGINS